MIVASGLLWLNVVHPFYEDFVEWRLTKIPIGSGQTELDTVYFHNSRTMQFGWPFPIAKTFGISETPYLQPSEMEIIRKLSPNGEMVKMTLSDFVNRAPSLAKYMRQDMELPKDFKEMTRDGSVQSTNLAYNVMVALVLLALVALCCEWNLRRR